MRNVRHLRKPLLSKEIINVPNVHGFVIGQEYRVTMSKVNGIIEIHGIWKDGCYYYVNRLESGSPNNGTFKFDSLFHLNIKMNMEAMDKVSLENNWVMQDIKTKEYYTGQLNDDCWSFYPQRAMEFNDTDGINDFIKGLIEEQLHDDTASIWQLDAMKYRKFEFIELFNINEKE